MTHLNTDLKSIAALDVDGIKVHEGVERVYLDLGDFGIPTNDSSALSEIKALLASLDPANNAKLISGDQVGISLVMSGDMAEALSRLDVFSADDLGNLAKLGIDQLAVVQKDGASPLDLSKLQAITTSASQSPEVQIIGHDVQKDLHDELSSHLKH